MAKLTPEEATRAVEEMTDAGISEGEIDGFLRDNGFSSQEGGLTHNAQLTMDQPLATQALNFATGVAPVAGAISGGFAAAPLAERYIPRAVARFIPKAAISGAGQATGAFIGSVPNILRGKISAKEAAKQSLTAGVLGGGTEAGLNLATRSLASLGGVQQRAVSQALRSPTGAKTMWVSPGETAEANLGRKIVDIAGPQQGLTPGRLATVKTLDEMQAAGHTVDLTPTMATLDSAISKLETGGVGRGPNTALNNLRKIRSDLSLKYLDQGTVQGAPPRIAVSPEEADAINRDLQDAIGDAFGKPGGTPTIRNLKAVAKAHTTSFRAQTGTAESAAATGARMKAIEDLRGQISAKSPESFIRSVGDAIMTKGESGDQTALMALRAFDRSGKLENQIAQLAAQREWTGSQSRIAHNIKFEFIRRIPRLLAKTIGVVARPAGSAVAAYNVYDPMRNP